jgi:hypothetical protein
MATWWANSGVVPSLRTPEWNPSAKSIALSASFHSLPCSQ